MISTHEWIVRKGDGKIPPNFSSGLGAVRVGNLRSARVSCGLAYPGARRRSSLDTSLLCCCRSAGHPGLPGHGEGQGRGGGHQGALKDKEHAGQVEAIHLDLASLSSVRKCAKQLLDQEPKIHILINNAGENETTRTSNF